jgi:NAD(P)-dependent dehydrogenase (short-subunit alcohol dehydrogenase family)
MPEHVTGLLDGRSAIVTGAGSGVGRVSALRFAQEGARVVAADINLDNAKETVREIESVGGSAIAVGVDVSDEQQVQAMIAAAVDQYGRLDILFNNVGIPTPRLGLKFEEHTLEDFNRLVAVNLGGVFLGCKHAVLQFKKQGASPSSSGGVILNTGSVAGLVGWGGTVYGATKGGVIQLTRAVAIEAAPFGIRVNVICPAAMPLTGFMAAGGLDVDGAQRAEIAKVVGEQHPLGRAVTAEDCAEAALYLVSDASRNVTGVALPIDGGFVAK